MKLGNFFESAATCNPVNPKPVTFAVIARGLVLPGGTKNVAGAPQRAQVTAALVFLSTAEVQQHRLDARRALMARCKGDPEKKVDPVPFNDDDFDLELMLHMLAASIREWEPDLALPGGGRAGGPLFEGGPDQARELLIVRQANTLQKAYNDYVDEEHPEVADKATF